MELKMMEEKLELVKSDCFTIGVKLNEAELSTVKEKLDIPEDVTIIGFMDTTITSNKKEGFALTDKGLFWNFSGSSTGCSSNGGKSGKDNLTNEELALYTYTVNEKKGLFILDKCNLMSSKPMNMTIKLEDNDEGLFTVFNDFFKEYTAKDKTYDIKKLNNYLVSDIDDEPELSEAVIWYKKIFSSYENNEGSFTLNWSKHSLVVGPLHLFHRKLYKQFAVVTILFIIANALLSGTATVSLPVLIVFALAMTIINPYLFYIRYKKVEKSIESKNNSEDEKLDEYLKKGGVDLLSRALLVLGGLWFFVGYKISIIATILVVIYWVIKSMKPKVSPVKTTVKETEDVQ